MKITTVKGTNDYLPEEVRLRYYLQNQILNTYQDAGFERIMTPAVEDIENLDKSDGGDNLNLIFKILKRGDKLKKAMDSGSCRNETIYCFFSPFLASAYDFGSWYGSEAPPFPDALNTWIKPRPVTYSQPDAL